MLENILLPDGSPFAYWDCQTEFSKTYVVNALHPLASNTNPGTADLPFKTISWAAEILEPGERVLVEPGIYRECVRPQRGGESPQAMISYEASGNGEVIISGAETWQTNWEYSSGWMRVEDAKQPVDLACKVWMGKLPGQVFGGYNPFGTSNTSHMPFGTQYFYEYIPNGAPRHEYMQRRGLLFVDGKPLTQVIHPWDLWKQPGSFWVEDNGLVIHLRLLDDGSPYDHVLEFTAREQCFTPAQPYHGYIRVKGLTFEKVGNGMPQPQRGAVSTFCGHHWIIEDCTIRWANTIGVDIGQQSHWRYGETLKGFNIFRGNTVTDCGLCGLAAVPALRLTEVKKPGRDYQNRNLLVENNRFERNCWHNMEHYYESAAMKLHFTQDSLIHSNIILDTVYGPGIWTDFGNINTRITANAIIGVRSTMFGAIFVEASHEPVVVDNNIIWQVGGDSFGTAGGGHGIYEHDCDYLVVKNNLVHGAEGSAVYLHLGEKTRMVFNRGATGRKMQVLDNILNDCGLAVVLPTADNRSEGNVYGMFRQPAPLRIQNPEERLNLRAWRDFFGWDLQAIQASFKLQLDMPNLRLSIYFEIAQGVVEKQIDLQKGWQVMDIVMELRRSAAVQNQSGED